MRLVFPSLLKPKEIGYTLEEDWMQFWDQLYRGGKCRYVSDSAGSFLTYGDGLGQHSTASAVPIANLTDYCMSLSKYLLDHPEHQEFASNKLSRYFEINEERWREKIKFLKGLRYDESKPYRYFSLDSDFYLKVSGAPSKRHDKRWIPVPSEADGSDGFVWQQLVANDSSYVSCGLAAWHARQVFKQLYDGDGRWVEESAREWLKIEDQEFVCQAVDTLRSILTSSRQLEYAKRQLSCVMHNTGVNKDPSQNASDTLLVRL